MRIEPTDPRDPDARSLLEEHAIEMAVRYPDGAWEGIEGPKDMLWLARDAAGQAVGCVALRELQDRRLEVKHLYVVPGARRLGIANALMDAYEQEAQRRGAAIVLETGSRQPEAIALYRQRGYRTQARYHGADPDDACSLYFALEARQAW